MRQCDFTSIFKEVIGEPGNSGCAFVKEKKIYYPFQAVPKGFCPALLHTIIPYFVTLSNGGWMRWVKKMKDSSRRLKIPQNASRIKHMNRLFCNEVIVQCPDVENGVVVGIGPKRNGVRAVVVRVLDVKGQCPLSLTIGDIYEFKPDCVSTGQNFCLEAFHKLYPYLLLKDNPEGIPFKDKEGNSAIHCNCDKGSVSFIPNVLKHDKNEMRGFSAVGNIQCGNYKDLTVSVNFLQNKCRYHDSLNNYPTDNLAPPGLCLDAFHAAYPFALALLYDADFSKREKKDSVTVCCPSNNGIKLLVKREKKHSIFFMKFIKFLERIFKFFFYPVDKIYNDISLTVVSNSAECPLGHQADEKYFLNIHNQKVICPASFNSLFPSLVQMSYRSTTNKEVTNLLHCPDCQGAEYIVKRIKQLEKK